MANPDGYVNGSDLEPGNHTATDFLPPEPTRVERGHPVFVLEDGRALVIDAPPNDEFSNRYAPSVYEGLAALQDFIQAEREIRANTSLSDLGKEQALAPKIADAVQRLYRTQDDILNHDAVTDRRRAELFAVPVVAPGNAAQQLADREAREWFRGLNKDDREQFMPKIMSGQLPEVTRALARSPIPLSLDETKIQQAWRASVEFSNQDAMAEMRREEETSRWAYMLTERIGAKLAESPGVSAQSILSTLREMGATHSGPFKVRLVAKPKAA